MCELVQLWRRHVARDSGKADATFCT